MSEACVFCKIIKGELPASRVYEDADTVAFLDINPIAKGHTLVIPKRHHRQITDMPSGLLAKLIATARKIVRAQIEGLGAAGVNLTQANGAAAGQIVPHIHFHVIPRSQSPTETREWVPHEYESAEEMRFYAEKIRAAANG